MRATKIKLADNSRIETQIALTTVSIAENERHRFKMKINGNMQGIWNFQALNDKACKVLLDLEFEFAGSFIDRLFEPVFQHIANSLVDAFCKRAVELYGNE